MKNHDRLVEYKHLRMLLVQDCFREPEDLIVVIWTLKVINYAVTCQRLILSKVKADLK
jgi:hypothetical protein